MAQPWIGVVSLLCLLFCITSANQLADYATTDYESGEEICDEDPFQLWLLSIYTNRSVKPDIEQFNGTDILNETQDDLNFEIPEADKSGLLPPGHSINILVTSYHNKTAEVLLTLKSYNEDSTCGVGGFLPDFIPDNERHLLDNSSLDKDPEFLRGNCYTWTSFSVDAMGQLNVPFTPSDCGCFSLETYIILKVVNLSSKADFARPTVMKRSSLMCVNPQDNLMDFDEENNDNELTEEQEFEEENMTYLGPRASALVANGGNSTTVGTEDDKSKQKKMDRKEERQKQRKQLRKKMRQKQKKNHRQPSASSSSAGDTTTAPMCPGCPGWRRWIRKQKNRKQGRRKHGRKGRRRKGRTQGRRVSRTSAATTTVTKEEAMNVTSAKQFRSSLNFTDSGNGSLIEDDDDFSDSVVDVFLGLSENNDTDSAGSDSSNGSQEEILQQNHDDDKEASDKDGKRNGRIHSKKRKWVRKHLRKSKKVKNGKKRVSLGERMCCKYGIQNKKLFLYLNTNDSVNKQDVCNNPSRELLIWVPHKFKTNVDLCTLRFNQCCNQFTLEWLDNWNKRRAQRKARRQFKRLHANKTKSPLHQRRKHRRKDGKNKSIN